MSANSTDGRRFVITVSIRGETIPITDDTVVESLDTIVTQRISSLLSSAKVATTLKVLTADLTAPYDIAAG
jgi:hypothetical protein